jgi:hypothetical protein
VEGVVLDLLPAEHSDPVTRAMVAIGRPEKPKPDGS